MSKTIEFKLPWQKAYDEWAKSAPRDTDMESMFRDGYIYGKRDGETSVVERFAAFIRGQRVDWPF